MLDPARVGITGRCLVSQLGVDHWCPSIEPGPGERDLERAGAIESSGPLRDEGLTPLVSGEAIAVTLGASVSSGRFMDGRSLRRFWTGAFGRLLLTVMHDMPAS